MTNEPIIWDDVYPLPGPTPPSDTAQQFAALFDHPAPKRKRRKRTLRDGNSRVSTAREVQR